MSTGMDRLRITCDKTGWEFLYKGELIVGQVDAGNNDADYEEFVLALGTNVPTFADWSVSFPEQYRGQKGHYPDGARFMTVKRPDGRLTTQEFTYRRLPWELIRGLEIRHEKGKRKRQLRKSPVATQGEE